MVALLDAQIVVGNHDIVAAYHCPDKGSRWQLDIINLAAHDFRGGFFTVCDGLDCFCYTAAQ